MAVVINEFEVVPEQPRPAQAEQQSATGAPPRPPAAEELEHVLEKRRSRAMRLRAD